MMVLDSCYPKVGHAHHMTTLVLGRESRWDGPTSLTGAVGYVRFLEEAVVGLH